MDDLIELIVRGIINWMSAPKAERKSPPPVSTQAPPPAQPSIDRARMPNLPPAWQEQLRQVIVAGQRQQQPRRGKDRRPGPPPLPTAQQPVVIEQVAREAPATAPPIVASTHRKSTGASSASIHKWMTPQVLRQQYILTEILQPPLSLRENR